MKPDTLRRHLKATPFKPFNLRLKNARTLTVQQPNFASLSPDGGTLLLWANESELGEIVNLETVTRLKLQPRSSHNTSRNI